MLLTVLFACHAAPLAETGSSTTDTPSTTDTATPCTAVTWYRDADADGFGGDETTAACEPPSGYVATSGDCDDARADVAPGLPEVCDGVDQDCDGATDEDAPGDTTSWLDADGDGYGAPALSGVFCGVPVGRTLDGTDCDDARDDVYPAALEACDGVDQDCDGAEGTVVTRLTAAGPIDETAAWTGVSGAPAVVSAPADAVYAVCPGTWYVVIDAPAGITVSGLSDAAATTLDGGGADRPLTSWTSATLSGLTLRGGAIVGDGGALWTAGSFTGTDLVLASGTAARGGVWACDGCTGALTASVVQDGSAARGGDVWLDGGDVTLTDTTVVRGLADVGAGVYATGGAAWTMVRGEVASCSAALNGGGIASIDADITLTGTLISGNDSPLGGGVYVDGGALTLGADAILFDNYAPVGGGAYLTSAAASCAGSGSLEGVFGNASCGVTLGPAATLSSAACDWDGTGDNAPADVCDASGGAWSFGDDASFTLP